MIRLQKRRPSSFMNGGCEMNTIPDHAVIFDIDGVLLHLTRNEEKLFFDAFRDVFNVAEHHINPNWGSYKIRNDVEIVDELLERHFGRAPTQTEASAVLEHYTKSIDAGLLSGELSAREIEGAKPLLQSLAAGDTFRLGLATANIQETAEIRLKNADLWGYYHVTGYAEARGPKINILRDAISQLETNGGAISPDRIVYLGDQLGDLDAARENGVHFVGTSPSAEQRQVLRDNGAETVSEGHHETEALILGHLGLK